MMLASFATANIHCHMRAMDLWFFFGGGGRGIIVFNLWLLDMGNDNDLH